MKKPSFILLFLLIFLIQVSCKKEEIRAGNQIFGIWSLNSISDNKTDKKVTLPSDKVVLVTFNKNGIINEVYENTTPSEFAFVGLGSTFDLEDETSVRIINTASATAGGYLFTIKKLDKTTLILDREQGSTYQFSKK